MARGLAPQRFAFTAGTLVLLLSTVWWLGSLGGSVPTDPSTPTLPSVLPSLLLILGVLPLFFSGILFNAGLPWLGVPAAGDSATPASANANANATPMGLRGPIRAQWSQWAGAMVLGLAGLAHDPHLARVLASLGLAALAAGWGRCVLRFVRLMLSSPMVDKRHASVAAVAGSLGAALMLLAAASVAAGEVGAVHDTVNMATWAFAGIFCAAVAHRLLTEKAAPGPAAGRGGAPWLFGSMVAVLGFEGLVHWAPVPLALLAGVEALAGLGWMAQAMVWSLRRVPRQREFTLLLLGLACLGVSMLWAATSHGLQAAGLPGLDFAPAPEHISGVGFMGSTLLAVLTRKGHWTGVQNGRAEVVGTAT